MKQDSCNKSAKLFGFTPTSHHPAHGWSLQTLSGDRFVQQQLLGFVKPRYPGHVGASWQISLFYDVPWRLTVSWVTLSIRMFKFVIYDMGQGQERRLFALLFNIKGLRKFWAGERRLKEALFDNLQWNLAVEDTQSLPGNARKLSEPEFRRETPMWKSWNAASGESLGANESKTSHSPNFSQF